MSDESTGPTLPATRCPSCSALLDDCTGMGEASRPKHGDVSVCMYCGIVLVFRRDLTQRIATDDELRSFDLETCLQVQTLQRAATELSKLRRRN